MKAKSIRDWHRLHTLEETQQMAAEGIVIEFEQEGMSTNTPLAFEILNGAYLYFEIERERRSWLAKERRKAALPA